MTESTKATIDYFAGHVAYINAAEYVRVLRLRRGSGSAGGNS